MISKDDFKAVADLDLDLIKVKLMHEPSGEGWSPAKVDAVELEYRRFLYLMKKFPNEQIAPSVDVDTFWHYHILDTVKYGPDCQQALGYFLHHHPYFGVLGDDAEHMRDAGANRSRELYEQTFGDSDDQAATNASVANMQAGWAANDGAYCAVAGNRSAYCAAGAQAAYCAVANSQAPYCAAASRQAVYCAAGNKQAGYCAAGGKHSAYCAAGQKQAAYCAAGTKQAVYCAAATRQVTYCAAGNKKAAYCAAGAANASVANAPSYCAHRKHESVLVAA